MDDTEWLATRRGTFVAGEPFHLPADPGTAGLVVEPTQIPQAVRAGLPVIAVVGWPTGRHHSVIKAAEARLAVEAGADALWLALDPDAAPDAMLADAIAVHQSLTVEVGIVFPGTPDPAAVRVAEQLGASCLAVPASATLPATSLDICVYNAEPGQEAAIEWLEAGAARVFARPAEARLDLPKPRSSGPASVAGR